MFVSNFVLLALFESEELGTVKLDETSLQEAVNAILTYRDKNFAEGIPVYKFWPQRYVNGTWEAYPPNLQEPLKYFPTFEHWAKVILEAMGLGNLWEKIAPFLTELTSMAKSFHIPSDSDDSCVNLALGATLLERKQQYPNLYNAWTSTNKDYKSLFKILVKYAYKPYQNGTDGIDTRSYYLLRKFITQEKDLILPATWLMDLQENKKSYPYVAMPFNTNNVDLSVASNTLYGLTRHFVATQDSSLYDENIQKMILDTGKLLRWSIESREMLERPDLALVYYPSLQDFYYFVARNVFFMNKQKSKLLPVMEQVRQWLEDTMRGAGTDQLVDMFVWDRTHKHCYCDDFLGNFANKTRGEDRLFSTAMALNALLDIWTAESATCKRQFRADTPSSVRQIVEGGILYLNDYLFAINASYMNAFFSGSVKSFETLPFWFPGNFYEYLNGTKVVPRDPSQISNELIGSMQGVVSDKQYDQYLAQKWFGMSVPTEFHGYNSGSFPFWSSTPMTLAYSISAMSKFVVASECQ
jgi:hypothetical protein